MKLRLQSLIGLIWVMGIGVIPVRAQFVLPSQVATEEVVTYQLQEGNGRVVLPLPYARPEILKTNGYTKEVSEGAYLVELVFTQYPKRAEDWRTNYDWLLKERMRSLYSLDSSLFSRKEVRWKYVLQTAPASDPEARTFFHGFIVHWKPGESKSLSPDEPPIDSLMLVHPEMVIWNRILQQPNIELPDSSVWKIFERHPEWKNMLVVMDWTASMYKKGATALRWQQEMLGQGRIGHVVFFNDGNGKPHYQKKVGSTGGLFYVKPDGPEQLLRTMIRVKQGSMGGDAAENDVEALLKSSRSKRAKGFGELVLIADRGSSIRDISLARHLKRPVRILLFNNQEVILGRSGEKRVLRNVWIHPHYLTLASVTGGSIHTEYIEIVDLAEKKAGSIVSVGSFRYEKQENGSFKVIRKARTAN